MKLRILLITLFLLSSHYNFCQNPPNIDSLLNIYTKSKIDSVKLKTINRITSYYLYRDITKAKSFANEQLELAKELEDMEGRIKASHQLAIIYTSLSNFDSAKYYIENTIKLSKATNNLEQQSISTHSLVILEISKGNLDEAEELNKKNLLFNEKIKDTFGIALSYDTESSIYTDKGHYLLAINSAIKSLDIFKSLKNKIRIADAQYKLAVIENSLGNYDSSIEYSTRALQIYEEYEDLEFQASILNILGISYKLKKDNNKAINYFNKSLEISQSEGYQSIVLVSLPHLIDIYLENEENEKAKKLIDDGLNTSDSIGSELMTSSFNIRRAIYYKNTNNFEKAQNILDASLKSIGIDQDNLSRVYKIKSDIFKLQNNYKSAFENFELYKKLQDSTFNKEKISKINELRIINQTEQKEAEIAIQKEEIKTLNAQAKNDKLTKTLYSFGMFSFIAIAGLLYFGFKQRIKKNKIEREKQEEIFKQEIAYKKKELASQTLHLVQKSTFIQELKENLEKIKKSPELFKVEFRRLVMLLKKESAEDKDWEVFKSYFTEVHNNFDIKIKGLANDISEKEIRLASFLRMNLSTKEIASMLNVMPDSVTKSKYRLKKKLALGKEDDLTQFLNTL